MFIFESLRGEQFDDKIMVKSDEYKKGQLEVA